MGRVGYTIVLPENRPTETQRIPGGIAEANTPMMQRTFRLPAEGVRL
jgi:hypothetical protein